MRSFFHQLALFWKAANAPCKEHSEMASMARDDALEPGSRAGHKIHTGMCRGCRRYSEQVNLVSALMKPAAAGDTAPAAMPPEVRERLEAKLKA